MKTKNPRLSVVFAARNPHYEGNLLHRFQVFINGFMKLAEECDLFCELIFVEWNPPLEEPKLYNLLQWPPHNREKRRLRVIEVSSSLHTSFSNSDRMPIFEYIAKNVGIRRSRGEWILATNPDLLFNEELIRFLARGEFDPECFYRIDRRDVGHKIPTRLPLNKQFELCEKKLVRIHKVDGTVTLPTRSFSLAPLREWAGRLRNHWKKPALQTSRIPADGVHTFASGDFLLMSRKNWFKLGGFTEITTYYHIDSIMCWTAKTAGLKQIILDGGMRLYHQEHSRRTMKFFPSTNLEEWHARYLHCLEGGSVLRVNNEKWGLADVSLPEHTL